MEYKKLFLIVNPKSGMGLVKSKLLDIVDIFTRGGYLVTTYPTASRGDATTIASQISEDYSLVVCCGGDGTLNEVITGLMKNPNKFPLGYVPLGTLNEWSSSIGISKNAKQAASDILSGKIVPLDIGKFGDRFFSYTASFGAFTSASYSAPQDVKNALGQAAYFFEGVKSLSLIKPITLKVILDDQEISGSYLFGSVSNSLSMGGIIKLDQNLVKFDDGIFEVVLIENIDNLTEFQETLDAILKKDFNKRRIHLYKAQNITVLSKGIIDWTLDGEHAISNKQIDITNIHRAINFVIPEWNKGR